MKRLILVLVLAFVFCPSAILGALPPVPNGWQGTILIQMQPEHDPALDVLVSDEAMLVFEALAPSTKKPQPYMLLHGRINLAGTAILIEARWLAQLTTQIVIEHIAETLELDTSIVQAGISITVFADKESVATYFSAHVTEWIAIPK